MTPRRFPGFGLLPAAAVALAFAPAASAQLRVTTSSLPSGTVGVSYSTDLSATGGDRPYRWSLAGGSLPDGLSLGRGGGISGRPSRAGTWSFTVRVRDDDDETATQGLSIAIASPVAVTTGGLPAGTVGVRYTATLSASGGSGSYTWSIASGSLPGGLALDSRSGAIAGTPAAAGNFNFTVRAADSSGSAATRGLSISVAAALQVTTSSLPQAAVGVPYSASVAASGGTPPYTWSVSGSLPAGLSFAGGTIAGTPTAAGSSSFTVQVSDGARTASRQLSITVAAPALQIATASIPPGTVGTPYSAALAATGGTPPYAWSVNGSLPAGLALSGGAISGTPTAPGSSSFTVQVSDGAAATASRQLSITVGAPALQITTAALPGATVGAPYSATLAAAGGAAPYGWALSGSLPPGLALAGAEIAGTPTAAGLFTFTVHATDGTSTASRELSIAVSSPAVEIATASLPGGTVGAPYSAALAASGGSPPYTWALIGNPPPGISLSGATLAGTPTAPGTFGFTVQVTAGGASASRRFSITVGSAPLEITTSSLAPATVGVLYAQRLSAAGGAPPYSWSVAGSPPPGLLIAGDAITGVPAAPLSGSLTLRVTDAGGASATRDVPFSVAPAPLEVASAGLPPGTVGTPYRHALAASGGMPPYTWTATTQLPPGLTLAEGVVFGTPASAGTFTLGVRVSDAVGAAATGVLVFSIGAALSVSTAALEDGSVGVAYSRTLAATGGVPPYAWSVAAGALPEGLALNTSTGLLAGVPAASGSFPFTVRVRDAAGSEAGRQYTLGVASGLTVATAPVLPAGTAGTPYSHDLVAYGGRSPYRWSIVAGALPGGLSFDAASGTLAGTPLAAGQFRFTAAAEDSAAARSTREFTLSIAPALAISSAPSLPGGGAGTAYSQPLQAAGGTPPFVWTIAAGALPPGLLLDAATGFLSGTPTAPGTFAFTARVTDSLLAAAEKPFQIRILPGLAITGGAPARATVGSLYAHALAASGGLPPYTWSIAAGALPPGLVLDGASGEIAGTPSTAGEYAFAVRVADAAGLSGLREDVIAVALPALPGARIDGGAEVLEPLRQPIVAVVLAAPYPAQIHGELNLSFTPDADVPGDDPAVQFATGGRTAPFTIPPGATAATFAVPAMAFQTGTVAGAIRLSLALRAGSEDLTPAGGAAREMRLPRAAPSIRTASAALTAGGFEVRISGLSNSRELSGATVRLTGAPGGDLQTADVAVPLGELAARWFADGASRPFGSQFTLVLPFAVAGNVRSIESVTVTLANRSGISEPAVVRLAP